MRIFRDSILHIVLETGGNSISVQILVPEDGSWPHKDHVGNGMRFTSDPGPASVSFRMIFSAC